MSSFGKATPRPTKPEFKRYGTRRPEEELLQQFRKGTRRRRSKHMKGGGASMSTSKARTIFEPPSTAAKILLKNSIIQ